MQIDQRRVATIRLPQESRREVYIHPEGRGYRLCLVAKDEVVNVLLSAEDLLKLKRAVATLDLGDCSHTFDYVGSDESNQRASNSAQRTRSVFDDLERFNWKELDWLSFN